MSLFRFVNFVIFQIFAGATSASLKFNLYLYTVYCVTIHVSQCQTRIPESNVVIIVIFELPHDKTNKMACAPSEDSGQLWHLPSLIRVFAVRRKKASVLSYPLSAQ